MHFVDGPYAQRYIADVKKNKPAYIIISDWYEYITKTDVDPMYEFEQLRNYVEANYILRATGPGFELLEHKDRVAQKGAPFHSPL